jgi:hypothetical protein
MWYEIAIRVNGAAQIFSVNTGGQRGRLRLTKLFFQEPIIVPFQSKTVVVKASRHLITRFIVVSSQL